MSRDQNQIALFYKRWLTIDERIQMVESVDDWTKKYALATNSFWWLPFFIAHLVGRFITRREYAKMMAWRELAEYRAGSPVPKVVDPCD